MVRRLAQAAGITAGLGLAALGWALAEAHCFTLRRATVPLGLDQPVRLLHLSDLHLVPYQRDKIAWIRELASQPYDAVVLTGDLIGAPDALAALRECLAPLADRPGVFVFGSNDYYAPTFRNPLAYFGGPSSKWRAARTPATAQPSAELAALLTQLGWININNERAVLELGGVQVGWTGTDDPHIGRDDFPAGKATGTVRVGVTHAPYQRILGAFARDGAQLVLAGHTHGGQVAVPGHGALVTNCDLPAAMAKGLHLWSQDPHMWLHVSAGLGTSPLAPIRFACRPEATLLTLA